MKGFKVRLSFIQIIRITIVLLLSTFSFSGMSALASEENIFYYPHPETDFDDRTGYPLALLRLAFQQNPQLQKYSLRPTDIKMPRGRSLKLLESGIAVDIFWSISTKERDTALTKVDFDLYNGMFGYRLIMVNMEDKKEFETMDSLQPLKLKVAALGHDWPDYKILKDNDFNVQGTSSYSGLFSLLHRRRVDYLPRSIFEVWSEAEHFRNRHLEVVESFAVYYPISFNYYLNKDNQHLAELLQKSLYLLSENGDFDTLFSIVWQDSLAKSNLDKKLIFKINN